MSFGYGIGDLITVGTLAWTVYKSCKDAPESFRNIAQEVSTLHLVIKEFGETLSDQTLSTTQQTHLKVAGDGCHSTLKDLQKLIEKYERLGTKSKRTWDRIGWGAQPIADLRSRLVSNTVLLTAFISTSQVVTHRKLQKFLRECQDGKYESSVISYQTAESLNANDKETWREIRKELEGIGLTVAALEANKDFIVNWFQDAIATGAFEEQTSGDGSPHNSVNDEFQLKLGGHMSPQLKNLASENPSGLFHPNSQYLTLTVPDERSLEVPASHKTWSSPHLSISLDSLDDKDKFLNSTLDHVGSNPDNKESQKGKQRRVRRASRLTTLIGRLNLRSRETLFEAAAYGRLEKVKTQIENGADVEAYVEGMTPLCVAAQNGNYEIVRCLVQAGADVNSWSGAQANKIDETTSPLHENRIEQLMDLEPSDNLIPIEQTALHAAAASGHLNIAKLLLENGADCDLATRYFGWTSLQMAVVSGHKHIVTLLLSHTTNVDIVNKRGDTALLIATNHGFKEIAAVLLENGADADIANRKGQTPLYYAVIRGHKNTTIMLLEHGVNINRVGFEGVGGALHEAVRARLTNIIHLLLKSGADIDTTDWLHRTALFIAVDFGFREIVELLLKKGANPFIYSAEGRTPKVHAISTSRHPDIINMLISCEQSYTQTPRSPTENIETRQSYLNSAIIENVDIELPIQPQANTL